MSGKNSFRGIIVLYRTFYLLWGPRGVSKICKWTNDEWLALFRPFVPKERCQNMAFYYSIRKNATKIVPFITIPPVLNGAMGRWQLGHSLQSLPSFPTNFTIDEKRKWRHTIVWTPVRFIFKYSISKEYAPYCKQLVVFVKNALFFYTNVQFPPVKFVT